MKKLSKLFIIALALVLMLALVACDSENNGDETKDPADTNTQTNTPNESDSVTDDADGTQDPSDTSKDPSKDTSDVTTGTNEPEQPTEPEDPNKTDKIVGSVNDLVDALSKAIEGDSGASSKPSLSMESLIELFGKLDLKITGGFVGADNDAEVIIKGGLCYVKGRYKDTDSNGNTVWLPEVDIVKLYPSGVVSISTYADKTSVDVMPMKDLIGTDFPAIPEIKIDLKPLLEALKLAKDDIKADVDNQKYTFSSEYLSEVSEEIYKLFNSVGKSISTFGVNENNIISALELDFSKFETEGRITATAKVGKTLKQIKMEAAYKASESGDVNAELSVVCKDVFTFNAKLVMAQNELSSFELNAELPKNDLKLAVKANGGANASLTAEISDLKSNKLISLTATGKTESNGKVNINAELLIDVEKISKTFGGSSNGKLDGDGGIKKVTVTLGCKLTPDANGSYDRLDISASAKADEKEVFSGELYVSLSSFTTPSAEALSLHMLINNSQKISASVSTVAYSDKGFEYQLVLEYPDGESSMAKMKLTLKAPSDCEIILTDIEKKYIEKADKVFANYKAITDKIDELNALAAVYANTVYNYGDTNSFFTTDKTLGIVYLTTIYPSNGSEYGINTRISVEDKNYGLYYAENLGNFIDHKKGRMDIIETEILEVLEKEKAHFGDNFVKYAVCCKDPESDYYIAFVYFRGTYSLDYKPTAKDIYCDYIHWYTLGSGKIHNFVSSNYGKTCTDCGLSIMGIENIFG